MNNLVSAYPHIFAIVNYHTAFAYYFVLDGLLVNQVAMYLSLWFAGLKRLVQPFCPVIDAVESCFVFIAYIDGYLHGISLVS